VFCNRAFYGTDAIAWTKLSFAPQKLTDINQLLAEFILYKRCFWGASALPFYNAQ